MAKKNIVTHQNHFHWTILLIACLVVLALWAHVLDAYVLQSFPITRAGQTNTFVQSAMAETGSTLVTASFRQAPTEGNLLVAVLAGSGSMPAPDQEGWIRAAQSEEGVSPVQAIFYREAVDGEPKAISMSNLPREGMHVLHVYEYRYVDIDAGVMGSATASDIGRSASMHPDHAPAERLLDFTAVVLSDRENVHAVSPSGFTVRKTEQTKGGDGITVLAADRFSQFGDTEQYSADFGGYAPWTIQTVTFRTSISIDAVQVFSELGVGVTIEATSSASEEEGVIEGDSIVYSFTVTNTEDDPVTHPMFLVRVPRHIQLKTASVDTGAYYPRSGIWSMDELPAGETATLLVTAYVPAGAADTTFLFRALLESYDGMVEGQPLPWDAVYTNVLHYPRLNPETVVCPEITEKSVTAQSVGSSSIVNLTLSAQEATYMLIAETPDILSAEVHPYSSSASFDMSTTEGERAVYVWFANTCDPVSSVSDIVDNPEE